VAARASAPSVRVWRAGDQLASVGVPEPGVDERRARRRWAWGTAAGVVAALVAVVVTTVVTKPSEPTGYGPDLEREFTGWCQRSGGDDDDGAGTAACDCAYDALAANVPFARFREVDEQLGTDDELPPDLQAVVAPCVEDG
jgi:hypothetical protein